MKKQLNKILICLLLVISCLCGALFSMANNIVYAVSNATEYTNVLYDLKTDDDFKVTDYPYNKNNYSLKVIQIAESVNDELFVYVYQPCSPNIDLQATSIIISKGIDENLNNVEYKLKLVNFNGVFYKYKVDDFVLETTETRYYEITSIYRKWNENYDETTGTDNTISEVAFAVGKRFIAQTKNGKVTYNCCNVDVIEITDFYLDSFRYWFGWFGIAHEKVDRHFFAFSTDRDIDKLYEVQMNFKTKDYTATNIELLPLDLIGWQVSKTYESPVEHPITLCSDNKAEQEAVGIFGRGYTWSRIETASDFLSTNTDIEQTTIDNVRNKQYVLSFYESYWAQTDTALVNCVAGTEVYDVELIRLKFLSNGTVYNLGVISPKVSSDNIPSNYDQYIFGASKNNIKAFLSILLFIVILIICAPILPYIFNFIIWLFKGIWQVISAPFKAIKKQKKKTKKGGGKK